MTAPLAPKVVKWSATAIPALVVTAQPVAHRAGMAAAQAQRWRARRGRAMPVPGRGRRR